MNLRKIDLWVIGLGKNKFVGFVMILSVLIAVLRLADLRAKDSFVMILSVLIAELKLGTAFLLKQAFSRIKLIKSLGAMTAVIITALIDSDLFALFPFKQGAVAIRTEVFGLFVFTESLV